MSGVLENWSGKFVGVDTAIAETVGTHWYPVFRPMPTCRKASTAPIPGQQQLPVPELHIQLPLAAPLAISTLLDLQECCDEIWNLRIP